MLPAKTSARTVALRVGLLELLIVLAGLIFVRKEIYLAGQFKSMVLHWQEYVLLVLMFCDGVLRGWGEVESRGKFSTPFRARSLRYLLPFTLFLYVSCGSLCEKMNVACIQQEWWRDLGLLLLSSGVFVSGWEQRTRPRELEGCVLPAINRDVSKSESKASITGEESGIKVDEDSATKVGEDSATKIGEDADGASLPGLNVAKTDEESGTKVGEDVDGASIPGLNAAKTDEESGTKVGEDADGTSLPGLNVAKVDEESGTKIGEDADGTSIPRLNAAKTGEDADGASLPGLNVAKVDEDSRSSDESCKNDGSDLGKEATDRSNKEIGTSATGFDSDRSAEIRAEGPWKLLRFPDRSSILLELVGVSIALSAWMPLLTIPGLIVAFKWEVADLEALRLKKLGDQYSRYKKKSWLLIPFIY